MFCIKIEMSGKYVLCLFFLDFIRTKNMAMPALKCPYLTQCTLQQIRATAPRILTLGRESCPIFGHLVRKMSTSPANMQMNMTYDKIPREISLKNMAILSTLKKTSSSISESKKSDFLVHLKIVGFLKDMISTECGDLLCPFLKSTPITLQRVPMDQDTIQVNTTFEYDAFFNKKIEGKKRDNSYRIFKRIQRQSGLFPQAQEQNNLNQDVNSRMITVWCSNDYLGLGQHPKLKQAVMYA